MNNLVLVVDDEPEIREAIVSFLEFEGLFSIEAKNGREALEMVKNNKNIKFIISDSRMPNGNGLFLIDEINKLTTEKPHIILLCGQEDISKEDAISRGVLDMFIKPPDMNYIISLIKKTLNC